MINLFDPVNHDRLMNAPDGNPGARDDWDIRPGWHGLVCGNGKPGSGKESVVSDEAQFAWPVLYKEDGSMSLPPKESRYASRMVIESAEVSKRHRRTSAELVRQVLELAGRGLVLTAIGDAVNVSDRRVKEIIRDNLHMSTRSEGRSKPSLAVERSTSSGGG